MTTKEQSSQRGHKHPNYLEIPLPCSHKALTLHSEGLHILLNLTRQHKPSISLLEQQAATGGVFAFNTRAFPRTSSGKSHLLHGGYTMQKVTSWKCTQTHLKTCLGKNKQRLCLIPFWEKLEHNPAAVLGFVSAPGRCNRGNKAMASNLKNLESKKAAQMGRGTAQSKWKMFLHHDIGTGRTDVTRSRSIPWNDDIFALYDQLIPTRNTLEGWQTTRKIFLQSNEFKGKQ